MKKRLAIIIAPILFTITSARAQSLTGQIAHWTFNGSCLDMTGHGHDGTPHNLVSTAGKSGMAGTAYYFSGVPDIANASYITVPYKSDINLDHFSICATIKVMGFYKGVCQGNMLLSRGKPGSPGSYELLFFDNPVDNDCSVVDTTGDVFATSSGTDAPASVTDWSYTPTVIENQWYSVVATYNDTVYQIYVNGVLKNTVTIATHTPVATDADSLSIGYNIYEQAAGFPYPFNGVIDDMMLYNRVLSASEIKDYTSLDVKDVTPQQNILSISPNPAHDFLKLELNKQVKNAQVKIYNQLGQEVKSTLLNGAYLQLSLNDLPSGFYLVRIQNGDEMITEKFIKEK